MNFRVMAFLLLISSVLSACLPTAVSPPPLPPAAGPVVPVSPSEAPVSGGQVIDLRPASTFGWVEYRDQYYGYGIALPCYWTVYPTPARGLFSAMSTRSYSDAYFAANSERGEWKGGEAPAGVYNLDVIAIEAPDSFLKGEDAIRSLFATPGYASEQELVSLEPKSFGASHGYLATVKSGMQGGETSHSVYFELDPGTLLLFAPRPEGALDMLEIQSIINSLALTPSDAVVFPAEPPVGPAAGDPVTCG